jgi:hypothetical protein
MLCNFWWFGQTGFEFCLCYQYRIFESDSANTTGCFYKILTRSTNVALIILKVEVECVQLRGSLIGSMGNPWRAWCECSTRGSGPIIDTIVAPDLLQSQKFRSFHHRVLAQSTSAPRSTCYCPFALYTGIFILRI